MGANRPFANPSLYPAAFHATVQNGAGIMYTWDLPWTVKSSAKRFWLFLSLLRKDHEHPLHWNAVKRWSCRAEGGAVIAAIVQAGEPRVSVGRLVLMGRVK